MAGHTPERWEVVERGGMGYDVQPVLKPEREFFGLRGMFEHEADAILAASAPELKEQRDELLAALGYAIQFVDNSDTRDYIYTVIAKAKGEFDAS